MDSIYQDSDMPLVDFDFDMTEGDKMTAMFPNINIAPTRERERQEREREKRERERVRAGKQREREGEGERKRKKEKKSAKTQDTSQKADKILNALTSRGSDRNLNNSLYGNATLMDYTYAPTRQTTLMHQPSQTHQHPQSKQNVDPNKITPMSTFNPRSSESPMSTKAAALLAKRETENYSIWMSLQKGVPQSTLEKPHTSDHHRHTSDLGHSSRTLSHQDEDRQTERDRERQTERERDRQTERDRERKRETDRRERGRERDSDR